MKEVIAIIRPEKWHPTLDAAAETGAEQAFQLRVFGRGKQRGLRYLRPHKGEADGVMAFLPKRLVSWLVPDEFVGPLISAIVRINKNDNYGDGKVFVCPVEVAATEASASAPVAVGAAE